MLMTLALCLTLLPTPAWAAEDAPEGGAIVQQEQQEEISPAVSEQAGTNEEENGSEGGPQNTGTPDADGAEDSKADAPENGEDENAGNNADAAVSAVQTMIDALPIVSELDGMTADELDAAYDDIQAAYDAYEALNAEQQAQITGADFEALLGWFNSQTAPLEDAQSGVHTHCVCGGNGDVNGHTHSTNEWKAADSLPGTAGSYYLTRSVSGSWAVPEGEVNLCLNGQTINGKITIGSGATLTLTDCSDSGRVQGEVLVNGGKLELYSGTITGGVQVGKKGADYQTGSSFTMYGGAITGNEDYGGVFLVGTTNHIDPPSFTMHGGTISDNTAGASDGGGGGVYVGEKCSFTMDGGTITGNTATAGNGGGIYIHFNAGTVSISNATITGNKASATGNTSYGHGGGIYSERGVTVENVTITGNNSTFEGGGIYGKGAITLTDATVTDNSQYDVYYDGRESNTPELTISGSVKAGYYANYDWKLPILVSGALSEDSVIRVGVREGINPGAIAEPASGVTLSAENFKADAADSVTSLGNDGKVYLVPCTHEMDDTGYTCKKCKTQFDARVGDSAYYKTLTDAFNAARGSTVTLLRNVTLTGNCSSENYSATLDLNGKTVSTENKYIHVGGGNKSNTLTVKDSSKGGGTQALNVKFSVGSNGTLAVDDSYTGEISRVELQAGGALERFGGKIGELVLSNAAYGSTSTGYGLKLWKGNPNACTIGKITDNTKSKDLTVQDLLGTDYAKCELYGEKDDAWSIVPKTEKISELTGYTAYKVQFTECVHQCADDSNPVCSVCHKDLYTKITAKAADGTTKTAYFTEDSALENGYVEAIQTLNGWSNEGCTEPTLTLLRDMYAYGTSMPLTGTLTLEGGTHTAKNVTVAKNANVTFASGIYKGATIDGTATVKAGVTFTSTVTVNGTLNAKGGTFDDPVKFNGSSIANISGGTFTSDRVHGGVTFDYNVTGTITGGTFTFADFYTTKVKLSGGTFTIIKTNGDRKLADLLAEGAAYYGASDNQAVTNDRVNTLENVKVTSHKHNGGTDGKGICSVCKKQMAASLTVGGKTSWYAAFATAIEAANAADGEKTITLYQDVNGYVDGHSTTYELTRGPVTLATGGKTVTRVNLIAKGISLTVTGSNGGFYVTVDGKDAELTVNDGNTKLAIVTAKNGGKLSLSNGTFSRVAVKDDGSSASLSGGIYGEITSGNDYVKPYALLAKGYAYKKEDNTWVSNANIGLSKVTVEKAPFAVEKIYPNRDTNYTGNSAFATDGNITLTAVIAPETQGVTYYYRWELFDESDNDWTTHFGDVNTATHTGEKSKTLTISGLPTDKSYQYHIFVQCSNGYQCYSEPFTVTQHQHSWTYTLSEDKTTITAKCSECQQTGGSVTLKAPDESTLTYDGNGKAATLDNKLTTGATVSASDISYHMGESLTGNLPAGNYPTDAGEYKASITVGGVTASVAYTIEKATPKAEDFIFAAPTSLTYDGNTKRPDIKWASGVSGMGKIGMCCYNEDGEFVLPKDAGTYTVKINVAEGTNYKAATELTADGWKFSITKATVTMNNPTGTLNIINGTCQTYTYDFNNILPGLSGGNYGTISYGKADISLVSPSEYNYDASTAVSDRGVLTLAQFSAKDGKTTGKIGTVKVNVTTTNYADFQLKLVLYAVDQIKPEPDGTITASEITYGQTLSESRISGTMKDPDTGNSVNGTFAWTDGTINPNAGGYEAEWTFTPAAGYEKYATVTGTVTIKVNKATIPASAITAPAANALTYNGNEQALITAGMTDHGTMQYSLTENGTYSQDIPTGTDAGAYTVWYRVIGDANHNDTAPASVAVRIGKKPLTITGVTAASKTYDGTTNANISSVTFDNVTLKRDTDYNVTASFDYASVDRGKNVTATVTLMGQTAKNYFLEQSSFTTTGSITKAAAPDFTKETALVIINDYEKTYTVTLPALPTLEKPKEYGAPTYELGEIKLNDSYYTSGAKVENGELTLPIQKNDVKTTGSVGTATVVIKSTNYEDITLTVNVSAVNKIKPTPVGEITASEITYGDTLSKSKISGKMKDLDTGKEVEGTFTWPYPYDKPSQTGDYNVTWIFTPAKGYEEYETVTGIVKVPVAPKSIEGATITLEKYEFAYNAKEQSPKITGVTLENWDKTRITYNIKGGGKATDASDRITLTIEGTGNYTGTATAEWKIIPAKLTVGVSSVKKEYDGTTNATVTPTFNGLQGKDNLTAEDYSVTAAFDDAKVGYKKIVTGKVTLNQTDTAKNYLLNDGNFRTDNGTIAKAAAPTVQPVELTIYNGVQRDYYVDLPPLPELGEGKSYGTVDYSNPHMINLPEGYKAQSMVVADPDNLNTHRLLLHMTQTGSRIGEICKVTIPVETSNYKNIDLTVNVNAVNQIDPEPNGRITATPITYGNELSTSAITGTMQDPATGDAVNGTFTWDTPAMKLNAGSHDAKWTFTPDESYGGKYTTNTGTATVTVAKRGATVTPDNKSKVYQEKDPDLTYKVDGVLDGETLTGITLTRAKGEDAGEYAITGTAASANPNYDVKFVKGTFTIEPKSIKDAKVVLGKGLAANGAEQTQTVEKVLLVNKELPADSYTVSGNTATAHGIYTLTVTGKGNYKDYVKWTYVIAPAKAEDAPGEDITIGNGKVKVDVLPEGAVPSVGLLTDKAELLAMLVNSGDITADELVQIANGASVDIVLTVKEANVSDEVKTAMAQAAKDYTIGQYFDISLLKYMTVNGSQQAGVPLHTTKDALTISVVVPDALINTNSAVNRTYCIVRNHEGTITVLDAAFDAAGKTLTFKTDRFSIYAIAYKDTAVPSSGSNPGSNNSSNDSETKKNEVAAPTPAPTPASTSKPSTITAMPQTGDTSNPTLYVVLLVASLLGLAVVFVCKKRNDK